jgi:hypothetical protein
MICYANIHTNMRQVCCCHFTCPCFHFSGAYLKLVDQHFQDKPPLKTIVAGVLRSHDALSECQYKMLRVDRATEEK